MATSAAKVQFPKGSSVRFLGYGDGVPKSEQVLEKGEVYSVLEAEVGEDNSVAYVVSAPNPNFNSDKAEGKGNEATVEVEVFESELEQVPTKRRRTLAKDSKEAEAPTDEEMEEAEAPVRKSRKAKAATKTAKATKGDKATKSKLKEPSGEEEDKEIYEHLEEEDEDILAMVKDAKSVDDLVELAASVIEEAASNDYRLGGILYHINQDKGYKKIESGKYSARRGFSQFIRDKLNVEYRKAMYLIQIYVATNKFGIDPGKVAELGWTKMSKIVDVMDEKNADELLKLAEENGVRDLSEEIKTTYKEVGRTRGERKKMKTFRFRVFEDEAEALETTLKTVAEQMGYEGNSALSQAFTHIVMEYGAEHEIVKRVKRKAVAEEEAAESHEGTETEEQAPRRATRSAVVARNKTAKAKGNARAGARR
jgi:hypothetical protein